MGIGKYKDELIGAGIFIFLSLLFEALDVDKLVDRYTPSFDDILSTGVPEDPQDQGQEAGGDTGQESGFTAEDLEKDNP